MMGSSPWVSCFPWVPQAGKILPCLMSYNMSICRGQQVPSNLPLTRWIEVGPSETSQLFLLTMQHLPRQNNQKNPFPLRFFVNACLGSCNNLKDEKVCILQNKTKPNSDKEWLRACGNSICASLIHNKNAFYSSEKRKSCKLPC